MNADKMVIILSILLFSFIPFVSQESDSLVVSTETKDTLTESIVVSTETKDISTESIVVSTESKDTSTEPIVVSTESKEPLPQSQSIIKIKVNQKGSLKIINNTNIPNPNEIRIGAEIKGTNIDTITVDDIESEIELIWNNKLTTTYLMFYPLTYITDIDLSEFDSSEVTDMEYMFYNCISLKSINFSNIDTSNVNNMNVMFGNCKSLTSLDVSNFDTSKVEEMSSMFYGCDSLESLDLSKWNTQSVTDFRAMFRNCFNLKYLNLDGINTNSGELFNYMFVNCSSLKYLNLSDFVGSASSYFFMTGYMFCNCTSLIYIDLSNFASKSSSYWFFTIEHMFTGCKNLRYINKLIKLFANNTKAYLNGFFFIIFQVFASSSSNRAAHGKNPSICRLSMVTAPRRDGSDTQTIQDIPGLQNASTHNRELSRTGSGNPCYRSADSLSA